MVTIPQREAEPPGRTRHLHEQIQTALTQEIENGVFEKGEHLTEEMIAERFGVSRGPVRKAFQKLEDAGFLTRSGSRGMVVAEDRRPGKAMQARRASLAQPLDNSASWEAIYADVAGAASVHAVYGHWRVVETELANHYDVGRTVAREVLARLEHRGILRKSPRYRWYLPKMTFERTKNLYEMRALLEPVALRNAAQAVPRHVLVDMEAELSAALGSAHQLTSADYDRLERRLHVELLAYGRNDLLYETLSHFHALMVTNVSLYRATHSQFGGEPFPREHHAIIRALLDDDHSGAARLMEAHMDASLSRITERLTYMADKIELAPLSFFHPVDDPANS